MDSRALLALLVLASYFALGTLLALWSRRRALGEGERGFFLAGGRLGGFLSAMTYAATTYSSFMIVGLVGFAYATGVGSLGFELVYFVATLALLSLLGPRVWRRAREEGWVTPGDMLESIYGSRLPATVSAVVFLIALIPYASAQLRGIGLSFQALTGLEEGLLVGVAFALGTMLLWVLVSGMWSVAVTDALQGLWMLASSILLLVWLGSLLSSSGLGWGEVNRVLAHSGLEGPGSFWTPSVFLAFTLPWMFFAFTNPQVVQRLYVPRDNASFRRMVLLFALFGIAYTVIVTLLGLLARAGVEAGVLVLEVESRDQVTPRLLALAPPLLSALVFTSIVAASISTADSILLTLSSTTSRDIARGLPPEKRLRLARAVIVALSLATAGVAASGAGYIVQLSVLSSLMLLSLAPTTILGVLGLRSHPKLASLSIALGVIMMAAATLYNDLNPLKAFASKPLGVPIALWILGTSTLILLAGHRVKDKSRY